MTRSVSVHIDGVAIGGENPPYIVAELSGNHNGKIARAFAIMEAAKAAGVQAVKLQTYSADTITIDFDGPEFRIDHGLWKGRTLYDLYGEASTPWEWHDALFAHGRKLGLAVFSSPFDQTAIEFLESLNCPAYKIASFECIDLPLVRRAAETGKPIILSTGMANEREIQEAVEAVYQTGNKQLVLLHCVSAYPAPASEINLRAMQQLAGRFGAVTGLSDHTMGDTVAIGAVALGAALIEKHVTLKRSDGGADATFSLEPQELTALVAACRTSWQALGTGGFDRAESEKENLMFRRSLYVVADIAPGEPFTSDNIRSIRPGYGLAPKHYDELLGRKAAVALTRGTALSWSMVLPE